jgi:regulation of enolase protein 1 (concanavalin A-like superfamily)
VEKQDVLIARGWLHAERVFLRLERRENSVRALCSTDGAVWFQVGQTAFPAADPVAVGVFAVGAIDRTVYPGAYPGGTAICFEPFELWGSC